MFQSDLINEEKYNLNHKFYLFLKYLTKLRLNLNSAERLIEWAESECNRTCEEKIFYLKNFFQTNIDDKRKEICVHILDVIEDVLTFDLFLLALKINLIKAFLLEEAKKKAFGEAKKFESINMLSIEYDNLSINGPYTYRVQSALLSLFFFRSIERHELVESMPFLKITREFFEKLAKQIKSFHKLGLELNQIFLIVLNESINQSIKSLSGANYEKRIEKTLISIGMKKESLKKIHDKRDASTEFDFFFELNKRTYGISAKRTLRERYKQFIKTPQMSNIDVMIQITLGTDLRQQMAKDIVKHGVHTFVADEIYTKVECLQKIEGVYPTSQLNLETLKKLAS